jgi:hypothetical protein
MKTILRKQSLILSVNLLNMSFLPPPVSDIQGLTSARASLLRKPKIIFGFLLFLISISSSFSQAPVTVDVPCTGPTNPNSGYVTSSGTAKNYGFIWHGVNQAYRGFARFNVQNYVPANATVTAVTVVFWVETSTGSANNTYTKLFTGNTGTMSRADIWNAIGGTNVHGATTPNLDPAGEKSIAMNAEGVTFVESNKTQAINIGFSRASGGYGFRSYGSDGATYQATPDPARRPILRITYTPGCITPTLYTLNGGGSGCTVAVGLSGSQVGVNYQLVRNGSTNVGSAVAGTGAALNFGNQSAGTYTVVATGTGTFCPDALNMTGSVSVTILAPTVNAGPGMPGICQEGTTAALGGSVGGSATGGAWSSSAGGSFFPSATDLNATWTPPPSFDGVATLTLTTNGGGCGTAAAQKNITVAPLPSITGTLSVCVSNTTALSATGPVWTAPTGGTITTNGGDVIHTFSGSGEFNTAQTIPNAQVVGGGGGGGRNGGGGGGAGGLLYNTGITIPPGNTTVTVGAGGAPAASNNTTGSNGGNSEFGSITVIGGGGGASRDGGASGQDGGSGGGGGGSVGGSGSTSVTINCTGDANYSGHVTGNGNKNTGNIIFNYNGSSTSSSLRKGWASFDLSSIPAGATVTAVTLTYMLTATQTSSFNNNIYGFTGDPITMTAPQIMTGISGTTLFTGGLNANANVATTKTLNANGIAFVNNNVGNRINLGFERNSQGTNQFSFYGAGATAAQQPKLTITYTLPPNMYYGGEGISGQGSNGGNGTTPDPGCQAAGGGGGGAGSGGNNGVNNSGAAGGAGIQNSITGSNLWYAGGGGGAVTCNNAGSTGGNGGNGGGGNGGVTGSTPGGNGLANTGGGGGGGGTVAGSGGSGVVIVRYTPVLHNWTSDDQNVATVDPLTGVVTGVNPGTAEITYTSPNGCSASVTVTVSGSSSTAPTGINFSPDPYCMGNEVTLTPTGGTLAGGDNYAWYSASCGGTSQGTGSSITVAATSATYYVRAEGNCGNTTCAQVTINPPAMPTILSGNSVSSCTLLSENDWVYFIENDALLAAVRDNSGAPHLGATSVQVHNHGSVQTYNGEGYLQRVTAITPGNNAASRVRLYFTEAHFQNLKNSNASYAAKTYSDLRVTKFPGVLTSPSGIPELIYPVVTQSGFGSDHYLEFDNTNYSTFFIHFGENSPLPVSLTDFSSQCEGEFVMVRWTTATEQHSSHFNLERSRDGYTWEVVKTLPATGNSSTANSYEVRDYASTGNVIYYRLHQVDLDGKDEVFQAISVNCSSEGGNMLTVIPNPVQDAFAVHILSAHKGEANLQIIDLNGKMAYNRVIDIPAGSTVVYIEDAGLARGTYLITVSNEANIFKSVKLVVQ